METAPFEASRDLDLYLEGDVEAFKESSPGITITPDLIRDIRSGILCIKHNSLGNTTAIAAYEKSGFLSKRVQMERAISLL